MVTCALCKKSYDKLILSHLIPKFTFKQIKALEDTPNEAPIKLDYHRAVAIQVDEQITEYLLCKTCEDLFSKNGEKWLGIMGPKPTSFPLLELLQGQIPIDSNEIVSIYSANCISDRDQEALIYFAVSIFWRANVWPDADKYKNSLGVKYEKLFRQYLLERNPLKNIKLVVSVNNNHDFNAIISAPEVHKLDSGYMHMFCIPGLRFEMYVGKHPKEVASLFKNTTNNLILITEDALESPWTKRLGKRARERGIKYSGKLAKKYGNELVIPA
jgi:hypothetical protein